MRVAADANVILSAIIGKAALRVFTHAAVDVVTADSVLDEVREYLPVMAERYDLAPELVEAQLRLLAISVYQRTDYAKHIPTATQRIVSRDPDDVDLLALALSLHIPVWSNDKDFTNAGVELYTTAQLLRALQIK